MSGKGDKPRNCFSSEFRDNYESIDWSKYYYYVFWHGRPCGLQDKVHRLTEAQAKAQEKAISENSQCGVELYKFDTETEAQNFINEHVTTKTGSEGGVPPSSLQEGQAQVQDMPPSREA